MRFFFWCIRPYLYDFSSRWTCSVGVSFIKEFGKYFWVLGWIIYRVGIRPFLQGRCRFDPSCSSYAREALCTHTFLYALFLIIRRLIRCYPGPWTHDPVPSLSLPRCLWKTKKIY